MLISLLNNSKKNYEVHILNTKDIPMDNLPQHLKDTNFGLLNEKYKEMDLLVSMGAQVEPHIIKHFNENENNMRFHLCTHRNQ